MNVKPDRDGLYRAEDWRQSNPQYEYTPPVHSKCGRFVTVDFPLMWDAGRYAEASAKMDNKRGHRGS